MNLLKRIIRAISKACTPNETYHRAKAAADAEWEAYKRNR